MQRFTVWMLHAALLICVLNVGCLSRESTQSATPPQPSGSDVDAVPAAKPVLDDSEAVAKIESVTDKIRRDGDGAIIEVDFRGTDVSDDDLQPLTKLPRLRSVLLAETAITEAAFPTLGQIATLENLDLRDCNFGDAALAHLSGLQRLKALRLSGKNGACSVGDDGMQHVGKLPNLKVLAADFLWVSEDGLSHLNGLKNLQELYLAGTTIGDEAIVVMQQFPELRKLRLAATGIGEAGTAELPKLTKLEELDLSECSQILDAAMQPLAELKQLKKLNVWRLNISDDGIAPIGQLTNLESLNLDNTRLTDAGMANLSGLTKLTFLHLGSTQISDAGLVHLHPLKQLQELIVTRTTVTQAGVDELQKELPEAKIQLKYLGGE